MLVFSMPVRPVGVPNMGSISILGSNICLVWYSSFQITLPQTWPMIAAYLIASNELGMTCISSTCSWIKFSMASSQISSVGSVPLALNQSGESNRPKMYLGTIVSMILKQVGITSLLLHQSKGSVK